MILLSLCVIVIRVLDSYCICLFLELLWIYDLALRHSWRRVRVTQFFIGSGLVWWITVLLRGLHVSFVAFSCDWLMIFLTPVSMVSHRYWGHLHRLGTTLPSSSHLTVMALWGLFLQVCYLLFQDVVVTTWWHPFNLNVQNNYNLPRQTLYQNYLTLHYH